MLVTCLQITIMRLPPLYGMLRDLMFVIVASSSMIDLHVALSVGMTIRSYSSSGIYSSDSLSSSSSSSSS